jgi:hypothetical protein
MRDLAIFPLNTVLFPGGSLPLRVFEARYVDMVSECMRSGTPFGVCLITRGREVGDAAEHEPVGCLARIVDWDVQQQGVLQIRAQGGERFRVGAVRVQKDGLVRADVECLPDDPEAPVPEDLAICSKLLARIVADLEKRSPESISRAVAEPYAFDSAGWVANRLCEILPVPIRAKQKLMELPDPLARLGLVHQFLQQRRVV